MGKDVTFTSVNFPAMSLRHQGFRVKITEIHTDLDRMDSGFKVVKALNGRRDCVSFESHNFPGHFLRHRGFEGWVERADGAPVFAMDASWVVKPGLAGHGVSFESSNFPGHYIRHEGFVTFVRPNDGSPVFAADASFVPHGKGAKKLTKRAHPKAMGGKLRLISANFPAMSVRHQGFEYKITEIHSALDKADADLRVVPALNGMPGAVSFTSKHFPGHYLRHFAFRVVLQPGDHTPIFAADASFMVRPGLAGHGFISFESCNYPGHFIRHEGFLLWVRPRDGAPVYAADASFKPKGGCAKRLLALASGRAYDDTSSSSDSSDSD